MKHRIKSAIWKRTALSATVLGCLWSAHAIAGGVPNTFTAGTAAKASEVNANFQAVITTTGAVIAFAGLNAPTGWFLCDGSAHRPTPTPTPSSGHCTVAVTE